MSAFASLFAAAFASGMMFLAGCGASRSESGGAQAPAAGAAPTAATSAGLVGPRGEPQPMQAALRPSPRRGVLIFSRTLGFRHDSIPAGVECLNRIAREEGMDPDSTEDPASFEDSVLAAYDVIVFLNTTGDVLSEDQQRAMERFVRSGGGFIGVHSAADTEYGWEWYGRLVGAYFRSHPAIQQATIEVIDREHPATRHLPERWIRTDEWYDFRAQPAEGVRRLMMLDESSYSGGVMGAVHPIAWCQEFEGGRSFYTGGGHTSESFSEEEFVEHLRGALRWARGRRGGG